MSSLSAQKSALFGSAAGGGKKPGAPTASAPTTAKPVAHHPTPPPAAATTTATTVTSGLTLAQKQKKIGEAEVHLDKANKALKVTVFSWKPDHLSAAPNFEYASNAFKVAGDLNRAHAAMLQSVDSHEKADTHAAAALACAKAAQLAQGMGRHDLACEDFERGAELWGVNGDVDKCAETLSKAAKAAAAAAPAPVANKALTLHRRACDLICPPDASVEAMGRLHPNALATMRDAFAFLLSDKRTVKDGSALKHAHRMVRLLRGFEMESSMCKAMCAVTILQLAMGDIAQADATFLQDHLDNKQYIASRECRLAEDFIMATKTHDVDKMDAVLSNPDLNYLEPREVVLLAKKLSVFTAGPSSSSSSLSAAEKQLYKAADQTARDMEELMMLAPAAKPSKATKQPTNSAPQPSPQQPPVPTSAGPDDDEWTPDAPPVAGPSQIPSRNTRIVDDDDDDLDLT